MTGNTDMSVRGQKYSALIPKAPKRFGGWGVGVMGQGLEFRGWGSGVWSWGVRCRVWGVGGRV